MIEWRRLLVPAIFLTLLACEHIFPLRRRKRPWHLRLLVNLIVSAGVLLVGSLAVGSASLAGIDWGMGRGVGLLHVLALPPWAAVVLGVLLMDLTFYYWHLANHKIALLWRFHNVHHLDPDLDVSTSFRFHFIEIAYSTPFRLAQVLLLGISPATYVIYQMVFTCATMFHHANVRLPFLLERWLNKVIVTPRMHGIHHSAVLSETDSNYSVIFSWWDRSHGTLVLNIRQATIDIGVPGYRKGEDNRLGSLLLMPFRRQRDYWHPADGAEPAGHQVPAVKASEMLP
ncbi:MAG: sterol desaturase family protein [Planctomycetota bacterium]|jgi:sterol desaturase/sphingolipid hydroxylase (fatty acid hydroxylase superfamily)